MKTKLIIKYLVDQLCLGLSRLSLDSVEYQIVSLLLLKLLQFSYDLIK